MRKIVAILAFVSVAFCADIFVAKRASLLNSPSGDEIATLHVGSRVSLLSQDDKFAHVEYQGLVPDESVIAYARLGILEKDAQIFDMKSAQILEKLKDDYDNEWLKVSVKGYVAKENLISDIAQIYADGEELFKNRCGGCHALHGYDEFNINVWPSVIETMSSQAALEPNEFETLVRFLQSKAPID